MKKLLGLFRAGHKPDATALSAYLDGRLAAGEASALEAHVATCAACHLELASLRQVRTTLRAMPLAEAPRSFRLRAVDVEAPASSKVRAGTAAPWLRAMPALSGAAAAVFVVAVALDAAGGGGGSGQNSSVARTAMQAESQDATHNYALDSAASVTPPEALATGGAPQPSVSGDAATDDAATAVADGAARNALPGGTIASNPATGATGSGADAPPEATPGDVEAANEKTVGDDDGGISSLRVVEFAAGIIAVIGLVGALALRAKGRTT